MNIFILDTVPRYAARMHCDKHVVKMILESAQILSTVHHVANSATKTMYNPTHIQHPCVKWAGYSAANYRWLYALFIHLSEEYTHRYDKLHKTTQRLRHTLMGLPAHLRANAHLQPHDVKGFVLCMPDEYKDFSSAVQSYRAYYRGEKSHLLRYTNRKQPEWLNV